MTEVERDKQICRRYLQGETQSSLAQGFGLSKAWVGQILKRSGLTKEDRLAPLTRPAFVGVHLHKSVKDILRRECNKQKISMSQFVSDLITSKLLKKRRRES